MEPEWAAHDRVGPLFTVVPHAHPQTWSSCTVFITLFFSPPRPHKAPDSRILVHQYTRISVSHPSHSFLAARAFPGIALVSTARRFSSLPDLPLPVSFRRRSSSTISSGGLCRSFLVFFGLCRFSSVSVGLYPSLSVSAGLCPSSSVFVRLCWLSASAGLCPPLSISVGLYPPASVRNPNSRLASASAYSNGAVLWLSAVLVSQTRGVPAACAHQYTSLRQANIQSSDPAKNKHQTASGPSTIHEQSKTF